MIRVLSFYNEDVSISAQKIIAFRGWKRLLAIELEINKTYIVIVK